MVMPVGFLHDRFQRGRVTTPGTLDQSLTMSERNRSLGISLGLDRQHRFSPPSPLSAVMSVESQVNQHRLDGLADPSAVFGHGPVDRVEPFAQVLVFLIRDTPGLLYYNASFLSIYSE
jgi:hypothetical protein